MSDRLLVVIAGPTASGKSETAAQLAKLTKGEIISADSVQIYKHINIGSSKPTSSQLKLAKHHLLDELEPAEKLNAFQYAVLAKERLAAICASGKTPILTGGTGLYIRAVIDGIFEGPKINKEKSDAVTKEAKEKGIEAMH